MGRNKAHASHARCGTLWEGRHKASLIDAEHYLLRCYRYIELNPRGKEWDALMCTFQEKVPEAGPDEWWALMEQVYDLA